MLKVTIPLAPVPASRPRVSRWGTYYAPTYKRWMQQAAQLVNEAKDTIEVPCRVELEVVGARPKTTYRTMPRGDVDNYAKAALDLLTKKNYWLDDDLVVELHVTKRYALKGEAPATHVRIAPV